MEFRFNTVIINCIANLSLNIGYRTTGFLFWLTLNGLDNRHRTEPKLSFFFFNFTNIIDSSALDNDEPQVVVFPTLVYIIRLY